VSKDLSVRVHACPCGYVEDRDVNAAKNVLALGRSAALKLVEVRE
jgi:putative transposase